MSEEVKPLRGCGIPGPDFVCGDEGKPLCVSCASPGKIPVWVTELATLLRAHHAGPVGGFTTQNIRAILILADALDARQSGLYGGQSFEYN